MDWIQIEEAGPATYLMLGSVSLLGMLREPGYDSFAR